jgi:serine/threonine protein kinase
MSEKYIRKYKIIEEIGRGGMGIVYKGEDVELGRTVAIKTIAAQLAFDQQSIARFMKEAKILAKLQHPNIVLIYDFIKEADMGFLIMEYIQGETVTARLAKDERFAVGQAAKIVNNVASALAHAHKQGIIHRDIKPENVMITKDGVVKVTDFGIAKLAMGTRTTLTKATPGTPCYMSPEQAMGGKVIDARSDIYSLGILFYEMVTGKLPFDDDSEYLIRERQIKTPPVPPSNFLPGLPAAFEQIILKCLAKNKSDRFKKVQDLIEALNNAGGIGGSSFYDGPTVNESEESLPAPRPKPRRALLFGAIGVAFVITLGLMHMFTDIIPSKDESLISSADESITPSKDEDLIPSGDESTTPSKDGNLIPSGDESISPSKDQKPSLPTLVLRSAESRNQELLTALKSQQGVVPQSVVKRIFTLQAGFKINVDRPDIEPSINDLLNRLTVVKKVEQGACDLLITLTQDLQEIKLIMRSNAFVDEKQESFSVDSDQQVLALLESIIYREYCFNVLGAFHLLNPGNEIDFKIEIKGKTDGMFQVGDMIDICVTPNQTAHGMLFNVNLDGIYLLYPRFGNEDNLLATDVPRCSGSIEVSPPTGNELILALGITDKRLLSSYHYQFSRDQPFYRWSYETRGADSAVGFCEQLFSSLSNTAPEKWSAKHRYIRTYE